MSITGLSEPRVVDSVTVPLDVVRLFPAASLDWTVIVEVAPAITDVGEAAIVVVDAEAVPATTLKLFEFPLAPPPVLVAVMKKLPVLVIVTAWLANTPFVKVPVVKVPPEIVPLELMSTVFPVLVKAVTVLPPASRAVTRTEKLVPAAWLGIAPPPAASTRTLASAPEATMLAYGLPKIGVPSNVIAIASVPTAVGV